MKTLKALIITAALLAFAVSAQETNSTPKQIETPKPISTTEAQKHYNETLIVTGKVAQVTIHPRVIYLNLDKKFPDSPFTGVIFSQATNQFGNVAQLEGKQVEVKGEIEEYRGKPQIVLTSSNQLKVVSGSRGN